ncbi:MAG: ABC transporter permease [Desulfurococcales archaeon ex4484_204]|nr:MAG: ABC transporter permease [Desulfurococcales archaeon ex4484_204]
MTALAEYIIYTSLAYATPILLAAEGELIAELSGVLNIGIEGTMLMGAFISYFTVLVTGNILLGVVVGLLWGVAAGLTIALFEVILACDYIVTGIGFNIMMMGLSSFLFDKLVVSVYNKVPYVAGIPRVSIPFLGQLPVVGSSIFSQHVLTYFALILVVPIWFVLSKTTWGLKIRAAGENPEATYALGINVVFVRLISAVVSTILVSLAGVSLCLELTRAFTHVMTAARGFVALSLIIFSGWRILRILPGSLLYGFLYSLPALMQAFGIPVPYQMLLSIPYIATIALMSIAYRRVKPPSALMKPFIKKG